MQDAGATHFTIEGLPIAGDALALEAGFDMAISVAAKLGLSYATA